MRPSEPFKFQQQSCSIHRASIQHKPLPLALEAASPRRNALCGGVLLTLRTPSGKLRPRFRVFSLRPGRYSTRRPATGILGPFVVGTELSVHMPRVQAISDKDLADSMHGVCCAETLLRWPQELRLYRFNPSQATDVRGREQASRCRGNVGRNATLKVSGRGTLRIWQYLRFPFTIARSPALVILGDLPHDVRS